MESNSFWRSNEILLDLLERNPDEKGLDQFQSQYDLIRSKFPATNSSLLSALGSC